MVQKGEREVLKTYLKWMKPGAGIFYLVAILLVVLAKKNLLFVWSFIFLAFVTYLFYQVEKMGKKEEALIGLADRIKRDLLLYSGFFAFLWIGLIFYLYKV